ncbi:hypothetical protein O181_003239 [Austropuccinia psidii MF-1]|uniref:Uncharacterized protein n=1 Tax=Austropuccinia psidii MF-1 TaxID=1389203 RepID=A0A9Q3GDN4_9BASI|nr:hypothetical protein [Austropuccinia psidii MF-1]
MDLDQDIQVINTKEKNSSPKERHQWRLPEFSPIPKGETAPLTLLVRVQKLTQLLFLLSDMNNFQQEAVGIYQSQYKNWFMEENKQEWKLLPNLWIGTMRYYLQVKKFVGVEETVDLLNVWTPMSCRAQVQRMEAWLKNQSILSEDQKK